MSTRCIFYRTGKPMNSTLRPTFDALTDWEVDCNFFEPFDVLSPEILLRDEGLGSAAPPTNPKTNKPYHVMDYNYVYIQAPVERYYWINKWERISGIWHAYTAEDVLASFRDDILETEQYVIRTGRSDLWDNSIPDTMYGYNFNGFDRKIYDSEVQAGPVWNSFNDIASNWDNKKSLMLGYLQVTSCAYETPNTGTGQQQVASPVPACTMNLHSVELLKGKQYQDAERINIRNFIRRLYIMPFEAPATARNYNMTPADLPIYDLIVGSYKDAKADNFSKYNPYDTDYLKNNCGKTWDYINVKAGNGPSGPSYCLLPCAQSITIWKFDLDKIRKDISVTYEKSNTYNSWSICFPPFGMVNINPNEYINKNILYISARTDLLTGYSELYEGIYNEDILSSYRLLATSNVSVDVQLTSTITTEQSFRRQSVQNTFDVLQSFGNSAASIASAAKDGGPVGMGISIAQNAVKDTNVIWRALDRPPMSVNSGIYGTTGCCLNAKRPTLMVTSYKLNDRFDYRFGRPLCKTKKLSDVSGQFCLCQNAIFGGAGIGHKALATERAAIESALNGGVYLA